jgi:hypothetical protein
MGDEYHEFVLVGSKETAEKFLFGLLVQRTADFVEQKDIAASEQSAGDGDALGLSLAETAASFTKLGVQSLRQVKDEIGTGIM